MAQSFYRPQTKTSFKRQFSPKSLKVGQKSGQRVQNSQNKDQMASDLLWESINSVHRPTVGIHQFCPRSYCGNPLFTNSATNLLCESINSGLRAAVGIHFLQIRPPTYCGNPSILSSELLWESTFYKMMDSHSRSDAIWSLFCEFWILWPDF